MRALETRVWRSPSVATISPNVTILARSARLLSAYEPEIGLALGDILRAEGLDVQTAARLPDDGRSPQDRRYLAPQRPRQAVLLRRVGARPGVFAL